MNHPTTTLTAAREETIDALCRGFAQDALTMPELERRLARARAAESAAELRALLADLPAAAPPVPTGEHRPARTADHPVRRSSYVAFAVMGGTRRAGQWSPSANMLAVAIMGGIELDFREAILEEGVTDINVFAFWGGVEIIVPPDVHVDTHGFALMGGFDQATSVPSRPKPGAPTIRVNGVAIMGGVDVRVVERGAKTGRTRDRWERMERRLERGE